MKLMRKKGIGWCELGEYPEKERRRRDNWEGDEGGNEKYNL